MAESQSPPIAFATTVSPVAETVGAALDREALDLPDEPEHASQQQAATNRFEVVASIGEGGMGRVLHAVDRQFGRHVALKEMLPARSSAGAKRRFTLEALVTGNLEHPGIPAVYERGHRDGRPYYVMRKVAGRTLTEAIDSAQTFERRVALLSHVLNVANTLGFAHANGVVHRDVKPDNVLIGGHGETWLVDWGIAKVRGRVDESAADEASRTAKPATLDGDILGTPTHMAPEQAAGRIEDINERTDVYALGALLYHVLAGVPPHGGPSAIKALEEAASGSYTPLSQRQRKIPAALVALVDKAMAKEPQDRFASATEFAEALGRIRDSAVVAPPTTLRIVSGGLSAVTVLLLLFASLAIWSIVPSLRDQGFFAYFFVSLSTLGCVLSVVEWRTEGRYRIAPVTLALALCTVFVGLTAAFGGVSMLLQFMTANEEALQGEAFRNQLMTGLNIALSTIATSSILAALQLMLWGLARRAALVAQDKARG